MELPHGAVIADSDAPDPQRPVLIYASWSHGYMMQRRPTMAAAVMRPDGGQPTWVEGFPLEDDPRSVAAAWEYYEEAYGSSWTSGQITLRVAEESQAAPVVKALIQQLQTEFDSTSSQPDDDAHASHGSWRSRKPRPLIEELQVAGLPVRRARTVALQIKDWSEDHRYQQAIDATKLLLKGELPILLDEGETEAALWEILPRILAITMNAHEIAQSLLVGAVCSGGVGEYAAWLELQEPGSNARHKSREGKYPVPGIQSPSDARMAYSRLIGRRSEGAARQARGHASTLNAEGRPTPHERYSWGSRPR